MTIIKSPGVTKTEQMLAGFCERSFLKLWSYPNPYKKDGHELCDLLAVFGNYVFIFFDRENKLPVTTEKDPQMLWDRWKRKVVDKQINTAHGAEQYIRRQQPIFLDSKCTIPFPIPIDIEDSIIHKIVVAHGAKDACAQASDQNIYGSLAITYGETEGGQTSPFFIEVDKNAPVHILDSHNLSIILSELDTVTDLSRYLDEKVRAIKKFNFLIYCGEEDLLAYYFLNFDKKQQRHVIDTDEEGINGIFIGEGDWCDFINTDIYKNTKNEDRISYFWDELIQRTCQNELDGVLGGNSDLMRGQSAIFEMVKEPRFIRRALAQTMMQAVANFPDHPDQLTRQVTFMPSFFAGVGYVFFQLRVTPHLRGRPDYLDKRRSLLEIACGAAKNKLSHLTKVIGIGVDAPNFAGKTNSEDFILLLCEDWTNEMRAHYEEGNQGLNFFGTAQLKQNNKHVTQFVPPNTINDSSSGKVGRNKPCPCGSGKKYKKCHGV